MWFIKFTNGPLAEQSFPLKDGDSIGRSQSCTINLNSEGISKQHAQFVFQDSDLIIIDKGSSNGTFVNGIKIDKERCKKKTHVSFHDVTAYVLYVNLNSSQLELDVPQDAAKNSSDKNAEDIKNSNSKNFKELLIRIFTKELLPGLYYFAQKIDFRYLFMLFVGGMIILTTSVSTVFLGRLMKTSIQKESQRRAISLAKNITAQNKVYLEKGPQTALSVSSTLQEPGVEDAFILSGNSHRILAPASRQQEYPDEKIKNVFTALDKNADHFEQIDNETIVAVSPVQVYDNRVGKFRSLAYSVVVYNMGDLAFQNEEMLSLFVQTLFISLLLGSIIFYFLYRILGQLFEHLSLQINKVMQSQIDSVQSPYQHPPLQSLVKKINEFIHREELNTDSAGDSHINYDKFQEVQNICQLIGYPAMAVSLEEQKVVCTNSLIADLIGEDPIHKDLNQLNDQSLQLSLQDLINNISETQQDAHSSINFNGYDYTINIQTVLGIEKLSYVMVIFIPSEQNE